MSPMGEVYPICCVFNTIEDAITANDQITEAIRVNQNPNTLPWSTPETRVTDGKAFFQAPDYFIDAITVPYELEEFNRNWREEGP